MPGSGTYEYTYKTEGNIHLATAVSCDDLKMSLQYNGAGSNTVSILESTVNTSGKAIRSSASYTSDGDHVNYSRDGNGISVNYTYDSNNQLASSAVQSSETLGTADVVTNYGYDSLGRNTTTYISGTVSLSYTYTNGQITGITRGGYIDVNTPKQNQTYGFEYDVWGNTITTKVGTITLAEYNYAVNNGNLTSMEYGNGAIVSYEYDKLDRIVKVLYNGTVKYTYSYNGDGALYSVTEGAKSHYYNYDGIGRLVSLCTYENNTLTAYQLCDYDEYSRTSSTTEKAGDNTVETNYTYDETNGLTTSVTQEYTVGGTTEENTTAYTYDYLKRVSKKTITTGENTITVNYRYEDNLNDTTYTSTLIDRKTYATGVHSSNAYKFEYTYDRVGNIKTAMRTSAYNSALDSTVRYGYDSQNQLVSERCAATNRAYVYEYDTYGNIRSKKAYTYGNYTDPAEIAANCELLYTESYTYGHAEWKDQLTAFNGTTISYDAIGNPLEYYNGESNYSFTWQNGRQMASADCDGLEIAYEYDIDGLRTKKTIQGGETYYYYYSGGKLHSMVWNNGENSLNFLYDGSGNPYSFVYRYKQNGTTYSSSYYYVTNLQGDVIAILTAGHAVVAEYTYDAWGKILSVTNASGASLAFDLTHIANLNPLRYRGYVYDTETGLYYLQSRYYDPAIGRFVNLDGFVTTGTSFGGFNMYAYCGNNPVMRSDPTGDFWGIVVAEKIVEYAVVTVAAFAIGVTSIDIIKNSEIKLPKVKTKENIKEKDITTTPSNEGLTYYHVTTFENASLIMASGVMTGSAWEGGYVYAWKTKPSKYAIENSGAHMGVTISFKTNETFVNDTGIDNPKVQVYGPVVSDKPGPIMVWDVQIVR